MRTKLCSVMISTMHIVIIPLLICCIVGGGEATFMAKPYAPLKELLSRMTNAPGSRSLRIQMAGTYKIVNASLVIDKSLLRQNIATTLMFKIVSRYSLPYDRCVWLHTPQIQRKRSVKTGIKSLTLFPGDFWLVPKFGCILNKFDIDSYVWRSIC